MALLLWVTWLSLEGTRSPYYALRHPSLCHVMETTIEIHWGTPNVPLVKGLYGLRWYLECHLESLCQRVLGVTPRKDPHSHYLMQPTYVYIAIYTDSPHIPRMCLISPCKAPINQQGSLLRVPPRVPRIQLHEMSLKVHRHIKSQPASYPKKNPNPL